MTKRTQCSESRVCDQVNLNYIQVVYICNKNTKQPVRCLTRHNRQYNSTSFRFSPLSAVHMDAHFKPGACYKNFDVYNIGHNSEYTNSGKHESCCYYTTHNQR